MGRELKPSLVSLVRTLILMDQDPTFMTSFNFNSIKPLFPNIVTLGVRALTYGFGRDTIQSIAVLKSLLHLVGLISSSLLTSSPKYLAL